MPNPYVKYEDMEGNDQEIEVDSQFQVAIVTLLDSISKALWMMIETEIEREVDRRTHRA